MRRRQIGIGHTALQNRERTRKRPTVDVNGDSNTRRQRPDVVTVPNGRDGGRARTGKTPVANGSGLPHRCGVAPVKGERYKNVANRKRAK